MQRIIISLALGFLGWNSLSARQSRPLPDAPSFIRDLDSSRDAAYRRSMILALASYDSLALPLSKRQLLLPRFLSLYRNDPDPGVHAALCWLLGQKYQGDTPRRLDWDQARILSGIDHEMAGSTSKNRGWFVNSLGQTMVFINGPVEFLMGSPDAEAGRTDDEIQHHVRIPRSFAIASREITVTEFQVFLDANPSVKSGYDYPDNPDRMTRVHETFSPDRNGPAIAMTWYEAAAYCNWLSTMEGIPDSELVYPANLNEIRDGMRIPSNYLHRLGYRLPTEAEWEFAARAGTTTSHFFGEGDSLLKEYAWYSVHPPATKSDPIDPADPHRTWPTGQLKPNPLGLFDIYGNVWEWIQDRRQEYTGNRTVDTEDTPGVVRDSIPRVRRGGSFAYEAATMRSAHRGVTNYFPMQRRDNVGFRIAKTISQSGAMK